MKKMNLVFVGHLQGFGGAEKSLTMLANAMSERGHDVSLISFSSDKRVYDINKNINYKFVPDVGRHKFSILSYRYRKLAHVFKQIKPDIVVGFWFQLGLLAMILSKLNNFKSIYSERGDPGDKEYSGFTGYIRNLSLPFFDGFVFQSKGARDFFAEKVRGKSSIIHNPVFIKHDDYTVTGERRKVIINVGRLHPQKNQKILIDAFSRLSIDYPEYSMEIYGEGELRDELSTQIISLNLQNRVFLKGAVSKVYDAIFDASIFVLSSDYEGMPNALLEAMALGIPCISSVCPPGGPREIIEEGKNGLIFPVGDMEKLADRIKLLLDNKEYAEQIGMAGKNVCLTHSKDTIYQKWEEYFYSVLN